MASSIQSNWVSSASCFCCRTCNMWCWRAFKWVPVILIVSIVSWSYYAYVIQLCIFTIESTMQQCIYLVLFHILLIMFLWSYWRTIFAEIKTIPDKYRLPEEELEKLLSAESEDQQRSILENFAKDLPIVTRTMSGSVRYCNRCVLVKPDRTHHCSICSKCVLKMDHHCPWVNNCVCWFNYKFFMLFLCYALLYCLFIMGTSLPYFVKFWRGEFGTAASVGRYHIVFAFFVSLMFGISLGSLFGYHCYLVANNRTTLDIALSFHRQTLPKGPIFNLFFRSMLNEAFRAPMFRGGADKNGFSMGAYQNFKEVFGNRPNLWPLPVFTSLGDGCDFPVHREHQLQLFAAPAQEPNPHGYESMGTTRSSGGDGLQYALPPPAEDAESLLSADRWDRWRDGRHADDQSSSYDEL